MMDMAKVSSILFTSLSLEARQHLQWWRMVLWLKDCTERHRNVQFLNSCLRVTNCMEVCECFQYYGRNQCHRLPITLQLSGTGLSVPSSEKSSNPSHYWSQGARLDGANFWGPMLKIPNFQKNILFKKIFLTFFSFIFTFQILHWVYVIQSVCPPAQTISLWELSFEFYGKLHGSWWKKNRLDSCGFHEPQVR